MMIHCDDDDGDVKIEEIKKHTGNSSALVLSTEKSKANLNRHIFVLKIISLLRYNISD